LAWWVAPLVTYANGMQGCAEAVQKEKGPPDSGGPFWGLWGRGLGGGAACAGGHLFVHAALPLAVE
jgi:hypothetical protein